MIQPLAICVPIQDLVSLFWKQLCYKNAQHEKIFKWKDERTGKEEINLYLFENDAVFERLANSPGRCFWLHFNSYEDRYFFWFQNPDESQDNVTVQRINELINLPETSVTTTAPVVANPPVTVAPTALPNATPALTPQALQQAMSGYLPNCLAGLANKIKSAFISPRLHPDNYPQCSC